MAVRSVLVLACVLGCYVPAPPPGALCTADQRCPDPLVCRFGRCVTDTPCTSIASGSGALVVPRLAQPLTIDGDLSDWPTCFVTLDQTTAGLVRDLGASGQFPDGEFSVAADATHVYVAAQVTIVPPLGDHATPEVFLNNAISVYFDGDGQFSTAAYDGDAAQIVVDHANREQAFRSGATITVPDVASAAVTGASTFSIEMSVTAATFGLAAFSGALGFDIGFVGGDGVTMTSELVWYQRCKAPQCGCGNGSAAPYCDAREFGTVSIGP